MSTEDARWDALLDRLSAEELTDAFLSRVLRIPDYEASLLPVAEIRRTGESSFAALIESLRSAPDTERSREILEATAVDVGVSRARARLPVASLMTAIRLDFTILWGALTAIAEEKDAPLLVDRAARVWDVVDGYATQTQSVYLAERGRMTQEESSVRQGWVAALFGAATAQSAQLDRIAEGLGVDVDAELTMAVAAAEHAAALRVAVAVASRRGAEVFTHPTADALAAFWVSDERAGTPRAELLQRVRRLCCGLVPMVDGLAALWSSARLARELALLPRGEDEGALTVDTAWARLARVRLADAGLAVDAVVVRALAGCGPVERQRLREAVVAYLANGSVAETAERLYCHRNTVMNRLRRFTDLTGLDPTVPREAARLVVAWS